MNAKPYVEGESGRTTTYQTPYIQLIYTLYRLFGFGQRQITGYFEDLWHSEGLEITVPSFGHLCDLFSQITLEIKQYYNKLAERTRKGEAISLILDSTGLRFNTSSNWYAMKYNKICKNKPWQKMHFSMDPKMNIHDVEITDCHTSDIEMLESLIPENILVDRVIADIAYYSIEGVKKLSNRGITPVIPTPSNAKIYGQDNIILHDRVVSYLSKKGNIYAFYKKYCYGIRARIEAQFSRIKRCIGSSLLTK
ncbi:MAG TPA: transposase, partial [Rickettsia endosymbiont of Columbicola hoogstraali]|nr:transposase [Rickettsia endosymbiont of Columbicola hoogstraali]